MKLLFDHNLSPDLISRLDDLFPGSDHVYRLGLHERDDRVVWSYARERRFVIVSKDADFAEISMLQGFPPKLLWLRVGNCTTSDIEDLFRANQVAIVEFTDDQERGILSLFRREGAGK